MAKCLAGTWVLRKAGSDYLPGLEEYSGVPFPALLSPDSDCWLGIHQKLSFGNVEEVSFSFRSHRTETRIFQVGKLNYEKVAKKGAILAIVTGVNQEFRECSISRLGPAPGQRSDETYNLDENGDEVRVSVSMILPDGSKIKMVRYLTRCETADGSHTPPINFSNSHRSYGWQSAINHTAFALSKFELRLMDPIEVTTPDDGIPPPAASPSSRTPSPGFNSPDGSGKVGAGASGSTKTGGSGGGGAGTYDQYAISKRHGDKVSNGEQIIVYELLLQNKDPQSPSAWMVPHRYREFLSLKQFVDQEMGSIEPNAGPLPHFPGKSPFTLGTNGLLARREALERYMVGLFAAVADGFGTQNIVDALCSFLELPENSFGPAPGADMPIRREASAPTVPSGTVAGKPNTNGPSDNSGIDASAAFVRPKFGVKQTSQWLNNVDTSSNHNNQQQRAADKLFSMLVNGLEVTKHGRTGKPKKRTILCDTGVTRIYWCKTKANGDLDPEESKSIRLEDVYDLRKGTDNDRGDSSKIATAILRRTCKPENLPLCISLCTPERTLDIEFKSQLDFNDIFPALVVHIKYLIDAQAKRTVNVATR